MRWGLALATLFVCSAERANAQADTPPLSQWQHTVWTGNTGPPRDGGYAMQRSPDGYLWLSSTRGLMRFDGVRFTFMDSTNTPALRAPLGGRFVPKLVDRSGVMWVSGPNGVLLRYRDGQFRVVLPTGSSHIFDVTEDGLGRLWVLTDRLQLLVNERLQPAPLPTGVPDTGVYGVERDVRNGLWIGTYTGGLWHVEGATATQYGSGRMRALTQTADGTLWAIGEGLGQGLWRLAKGEWSEVRLPNSSTGIAARAAKEGSDGSVWFPTNVLGVLRWRDGRMEQFSKRDGLSDDAVRSLVVDVEGPVWVVTEAGFDRLRPGVFVTIESRDGLPFESGTQFAVARDGAIWTQDRRETELWILDDGPIRQQSGRITSEQRHLPFKSFQLLAAARAGGVWLGPFGGGIIHEASRGRQFFGQREGFPRERLTEVLETRDGTLWTRTVGGAIGRVRDGKYRTIQVPDGTIINALVEDGLGRVWTAFARTRRLVALAGDSVVVDVSLPKTDSSQVSALALEAGDTVWAAAGFSLFRVSDGRAAEVRIPALATVLESGPELAVSGGSLWLAGRSGIAQVALADLHRAADGEAASVDPVVFDALDGIALPRSAALVSPVIRVGPDGRVWLATLSGLAVARPGPRVVNRVPPRVHIEDVSLRGRPISLIDGGTIPPNPDRIAIHFSAPSLGLPERMRVEYRLGGADKDWVDGKPPRVATYNQLGPGRYVFRVRAWNEDGVPGAGEATLRFRVLPAWYRTWWFLGVCFLGVAAIGAATGFRVHRSRSRRAEAAAQARFDAVLAERTRLARELHDTLLQGFTGITLQLDGVRGTLEDQSQPLATTLSAILERADKTLREAREMVWNIRQPALSDGDLGEALQTAAHSLSNPAGIVLKHIVTGAPRHLSPSVTTTVLRIAKEAIMNALQHANPTSVTVHLTYEPRRVLLEIGDDGHGVDPAWLEASTKRGHWGVAGMRERARAAGGTVVITTTPGEGTRVNLSLPSEPTV